MSIKNPGLTWTTRRRTLFFRSTLSMELATFLDQPSRLFTKNFWLITKIVFVIVAPFELFKVMSIGDVADDWQLTFGVFLLELMCKVLIAPALIYALMKVMQTGVAPGVNESYRWGFSKLGKLGVCAVISWLLQAVGYLHVDYSGHHHWSVAEFGISNCRTGERLGVGRAAAAVMN